MRGAGFVVFEALFGTVDVSLLGPLVSSAKEKNHHLADPGEVDAVSGPPIDPELHHTFADRLCVAEGSGGDSRKPRLDSRARLPIPQAFQPVDEGPPAGGCLVVMKLYGDCNL